MKLTDCIEFALQHPAGSLATVDGKQPRVRVILLWRANETGFYYQSTASKEVYEQIKTNPNIEVCFFNHAAEPEESKTLRVVGEIECLDDPGLKKELLADWPILSQVYSGPDDPTFALFRIAHGDAHFWTMADMGKGSKDLEHIKF